MGLSAVVAPELPRSLPDSTPRQVWELVAPRRAVTLSSVLADAVAVHVYRHQVADELAGAWPQRSNALRSCGEAGAVLFCAECDCSHVVPYRCTARSCPTCAHIASAVTVERLAKRSEAALRDLRIDDQWGGVGPHRRKTWKLLTATQETAGDYAEDSRFEVRALDRSIQRVRRAWGPFWRSSPWGKPLVMRHEVTGRKTIRSRKDTIFAMGIEVAPGGMVHLHAAIYGEYVPDTEIRAQWERQLGRGGYVKLNRMADDSAESFRKSLHEVLKYVSKGEASGRQHIRAAAVELAMRGVRRVEMGGAIRRMQQLTNQDVIKSAAPPCADCGTAGGKWRWGGLRNRAYVEANGGFGVDRWTDIREIPEARGDLRAAQYRGYYGGDAPGWMTAGDDELPPVDVAFS